MVGWELTICFSHETTVSILQGVLSLGPVPRLLTTPIPGASPHRCRGIGWLRGRKRCLAAALLTGLGEAGRCSSWTRVPSAQPGRPLSLTLCCIQLGTLRALRFHFALGPANYAAGLAGLSTCLSVASPIMPMGSTFEIFPPCQGLPRGLRLLSTFHPCPLQSLFNKATRGSF